MPAMAAALDTHRTVKRLKDAGFTESQAETVTDILRETRETELARLATKDDLEILKRDLTIRLGGMIVVATGILLAAGFFGR